MIVAMQSAVAVSSTFVPLGLSVAVFPARFIVELTTTLIGQRVLDVRCDQSRAILQDQA